MATLPERESRPAGNRAATNISTETVPSLAPVAGLREQPTPGLTEAEATALTGRIRSLAEAIADRVDLLLVKVREARDGQAHVALGYKSWTSYVQTEFADVLPRLDREPRRELVAALTETGMSTRAIAPVLGVSQSTIRDDVQVSRSYSPGDPMVDASDADFEIAITEARADGNLSRSNVERKIIANNVIGVDGKKYTRVEPKKPRRGSLPESYWRAAHDLQKVVKRLERLHADDRFVSNRETIADRNAATVARAANELLDLLTDLGVDRHKYGGAS